MEFLQASRLDRADTSLSAALLKFRISCSVLQALESLHYQGISDHAPLGVRISIKAKTTSGTHARPRLWCSTPAFKERLDLLIKKVFRDDMDHFHRLRTHKILFREAAFHARDALNFTGNKEFESRRLVFESMTRAIWFNDVRLATRLINATKIAPQYLRIDSKSVSAIDPLSFEQADISEKREFYRREECQLRDLLRMSESINEKPQLQSRLKASRRLQSVWWPAGRKIHLYGLRVDTEDGSQHCC